MALSLRAAVRNPGLISWISRIGSGVCQFATLRLITDYLGNVDLFVPIAIAFGISWWFTLADFGIGNFLQTRIALVPHIFNSTDHNFKNSFRFNFIFQILIIFFGIILSPFAGPYLLKNSHLNNHLTSILFSISVACLTLQNNITIVYKIYYSVGRPYTANLVYLSASIGSVILSIALRIHSNNHSPVLALLAMFAPGPCIGTVLFFNLYFRKIRKGTSVETDARFLSISSKYLLFSILTAGSAQIDYIILSRFCNGVEIASYNIIMRLFLFPNSLCLSYISSFWPAFTNNFREMKYAEIYSIIIKYLIYALSGLTVFFLLVCLCSRIIFHVLVPSLSIVLDLTLCLFCYLYIAVRIWCDSFTVVLQSGMLFINLYKYAAFQLVLSIALQLLLTSYFGVYGIPLGMAMAYLLTSFWGYPLAFHRLAKTSKKI